MMGKALSTREIELYMKQIPIIHNNFLGVCSANRLPSKWLAGQSLIVYCFPSNKPRIHWIAIFIRSASMYKFLDSTGSRPDRYKEMRLPSSCKTIYFRKQQIQGHF